MHVFYDWRRHAAEFFDLILQLHPTGIPVSEKERILWCSGYLKKITVKWQILNYIKSYRLTEWIFFEIVLREGTKVYMRKSAVQGCIATGALAKFHSSCYPSVFDTSTVKFALKI